MLEFRVRAGRGRYLFEFPTLPAGGGQPMNGQVMGYTLESLVEQYGPEDGKFIWDSFHCSNTDPVVYYIEIPEIARNNELEQADEYAKKQGKVLQTIRGSMDIIQKLIFAPRETKGNVVQDVLQVLPGYTIQPTWDELIMKAEKT